MSARQPISYSRRMSKGCHESGGAEEGAAAGALDAGATAAATMLRCGTSAAGIGCAGGGSAAGMRGRASGGAASTAAVRLYAGGIGMPASLSICFRPWFSSTIMVSLFDRSSVDCTKRSLSWFTATAELTRVVTWCCSSATYTQPKVGNVSG